MKKLFLLKGSFPDKILIRSSKNNIDLTYDITSSEQFLAEYNHLLAISKSPEYEQVQMFVSPPKCRMIWFEGSTQYGTGGWINLKKFDAISFYEYDEQTHSEIFEDLFLKYLQSNNNYVKRALTDFSYAHLHTPQHEYECNNDMVVAGHNLMEVAKCNYLFIFYNSTIIDLNYFLPHFLTNKQLTEVIAKKYNLIDYLMCDDSIKPTNYNYDADHTVLANTIKAILYAIYLTNRSYDDVEEIVRNFIILTDTCTQNMQLIREKYEKLAKYLKNKDKYDVQESITFDEVETVLNTKLDYQFFYYTNFFRDYGYIITKVDFVNKLIFLDISYW